MKVHKPLDEFCIRTAKGEVWFRCQARAVTSVGVQCTKKAQHLHKGDKVHSDGVFVWLAEDGVPTPIAWESAEDYFGVNVPPARPTAEQALIDWWMGKAADEAERTIPKAVEYGSTDLIDIGRNLARLSGREVTDAEAAELGVFFYLEGKFARWRSAIIEQRPVSDDTMFDIGVYVRMAQRIRESGGWPGVEKENVYKQQAYGEDTE